MRHRRLLSAVVLAAAIASGARTTGQTPGGQDQTPRIAGKPDLNGFWQAVNTANWDLEAHAAAPSPVVALGAVGAVPPGLGVVEGGRIPYQPWALAKRDENRKNTLAIDPEVRCLLPGVPRSTYLPYPFQIVQNADQIVIVYQYSYARREIHMTKHEEAPIDSWMGWSNGKWDGDTLVIDVTGFIEPSELRPGQPADQTWLDRSGNFHSGALHVVERYTPLGANHITYEATIEDPKVFARPWKMSMLLYRRLEKNMQLLEFKCVELTEELRYGNLRKPPSQ